MASFPRQLFGSSMLTPKILNKISAADKILALGMDETMAEASIPTSPSSSASTSTSFHTLKRENAFRNPNSEGPAVPMLEEIIRPHIESFDILWDDAGGPGLVQVGIDSMTPKVVFDGSHGVQDPLQGNRLESELSESLSNSYKEVISL